MCSQRPGQREAGGREQSPLRGSRLEASGGNCRSRSRRVQGQRARPSMGTRSPFPHAQAAPAPAGTGRLRERPPEGARWSTQGTCGSCLHDRPPDQPNSQPWVQPDPTSSGRPPSVPRETQGQQGHSGQLAPEGGEGVQPGASAITSLLLTWDLLMGSCRSESHLGASGSLSGTGARGEAGTQQREAGLDQPVLPASRGGL